MIACRSILRNEPRVIARYSGKAHEAGGARIVVRASTNFGSALISGQHCNAGTCPARTRLTLTDPAEPGLRRRLLLVLAIAPGAARTGHVVLAAAVSADHDDIVADTGRGGAEAGRIRVGDG